MIHWPRRFSGPLSRRACRGYEVEGCVCLRVPTNWRVIPRAGWARCCFVFPGAYRAASQAMVMCSTSRIEPSESQHDSQRDSAEERGRKSRGRRPRRGWKELLARLAGSTGTKGRSLETARPPVLSGEMRIRLRVLAFDRRACPSGCFWNDDVCENIRRDCSRKWKRPASSLQADTAAYWEDWLRKRLQASPSGRGWGPGTKPELVPGVTAARFEMVAICVTPHAFPAARPRHRTWTTTNEITPSSILSRRCHCRLGFNCK